MDGKSMQRKDKEREEWKWLDKEEGRLSPSLPFSPSNIKESTRSMAKKNKGGCKREEGAIEVVNLEWRSLQSMASWGVVIQCLVDFVVSGGKPDNGVWGYGCSRILANLSIFCNLA